MHNPHDHEDTYDHHDHDHSHDHVPENRVKKTSFSQYLAFFPSVEFPVILSEESHHVFSQQNDPLPGAAIQQFIQVHEPDEADELTEYVPCFQLKGTKHWVGVVYWRASLMNYEYHLLTYSPTGDLIDQKVIAGLSAGEEALFQSVATIRSDMSIYVVSGQMHVNSLTYDASNSTSILLQIQTEGKIDEVV